MKTYLLGLIDKDISSIETMLRNNNINPPTNTYLIASLKVEGSKLERIKDYRNRVESTL